MEREPRGVSLAWAERYEDLLRASADWVWDTDAGQHLIYVSPPVARDLRIPAQQLVGHRLCELGRFEAEGGRDGALALQARRPFRDARLILRDAEGRDVAFRISGVPYYDAATGTFAGHRGTAVRVTAAEADETDGAETAEAQGEGPQDELLKTLEEVLLRHNDLEWRLSLSHEADRTNRDRLSHLLHELRTPLNAVVGYAQLARQRVDGGGRDEDRALLDYLGNLCEAGEHMIRLISEMDRPADRPAGDDGDGRCEAAETPRPVPALPPVDLAQVVRDAKAMTELSARRAMVRFADMALAEPVMVEGDRKALTQIVVNLLANAVKFTPAGGEIGASLREHGRGAVRLAIWDTGPGIPSEEQERVFERNYRMPCHSGSDGPQGDGLGLAIARQLAHDNGAELTVESTPGNGATFCLDLRLAEASNVA